MTEDSIGVVTLTLGGPRLLRAMASVFTQDYTGPIEHVVVSDDNPAAVSVARAAPTRPGLRVSPHLVRRPPEEAGDLRRDIRHVYPRLSRLFNAGVRAATTTWIAFLDDDNELAPDHLSSLIACARANDADAVHSARTIHRPDGSPYLDEVWHTARDPQEGARIYELMCQRGVRIRGTNILMDRVDPVRPSSFRPSTVLQADDPVFLVDQSAWLIRRELLLAAPIPEEFTEEDFISNTAPDDKLLQVLMDRGVAIHSTGQPTLRYYLGGVSNNYRQPVATH
ncbi:glycosyltransferase family 2 protein [Nonomuraea endophytica]|uniref:Glycosyltransferase 2-like domain-containing protein n=1 Tax=Nonomuraea endophytica TaxID=714136 RepID=A0A7W8A5Q1_9ACTN|nr:glycosyltransferase [Nonomuraea endophytica]MBB5078753.1 hypothetical protein [Nonomuraea endophytica]